MEGTKVVGVPVKEEIKAVGVSGKLPKLAMEITAGGKVVRVIELDDPRERYMQTWTAFDNPR